MSRHRTKISTPTFHRAPRIVDRVEAHRRPSYIHAIDQGFDDGDAADRAYDMMRDREVGL